MSSALETGGNSLSAVRRRLSAALWPLSLASFAHLVFRSYVEPRNLFDFRTLYDGAVRFLDGASAYGDPWFLLTPSGLLIVAPFGLFDHDTGFAVWNTLSIAACLIGVALTLRFIGVSLRGPVAAGTLLALSLSEGLTSTLIFGNLNNTLLLALGAGFLLAERRGRSVLAGVLLGLSLAVKPVLILLVFIPLLRRGWYSLAWAAVIPAVLNVLGFLVTPHRDDFLRVTVPALVESRPDYNTSLTAVGAYFGVPEPALTALRLLVLAVALMVVWRLRTLEDTVLRLGVTYAVLLLATFLGASLSQMYYSILLLPLLLTVIRSTSPMYSPVAWLGVYLFSSLNYWALPGRPGPTEAFAVSRATIGWILLFGVLAVWALRRPQVARPASSSLLDDAEGSDPHGGVVAEPRRNSSGTAQVGPAPGSVDSSGLAGAVHLAGSAHGPQPESSGCLGQLRAIRG